MNAPCTVTRVIDRVAAEIANEARELDALARSFDSSNRPSRIDGERLREIARKLRAQAHQLTGRDYR